MEKQIFKLEQNLDSNYPGNNEALVQRWINHSVSYYMAIV